MQASAFTFPPQWQKCTVNEKPKKHFPQVVKEVKPEGQNTRQQGRLHEA